MAKMFYTLEEAATKLGMSVEDVKGLTESGQLQEFRDQDKVMLKVEQVDLLSGDQDDEMIPLADSGEIEPISLAESDSAPGLGGGLGDPDQTGVSIFDPEEEEDVDPAAATQVSPSLGDIADFGEASGSGSGLANLALEGDDTSLGADLLEDVYTSTGSGSRESESAVGASGIADTGGDLFEPAGTEPEAIGAAPAMAGMPAAAEAYDGAWSGLLAGIAVGMVVTLALAASVLILMLDGNQALMDQMSMNFVYIAVGAGLGIMLLGALIGWFLLRRS